MTDASNKEGTSEPFHYMMETRVNDLVDLYCGDALIN